MRRFSCFLHIPRHPHQHRPHPLYSRSFSHPTIPKAWCKRPLVPVAHLSFHPERLCAGSDSDFDNPSCGCDEERNLALVLEWIGRARDLRQTARTYVYQNMLCLITDKLPRQSPIITQLIGISSPMYARRATVEASPPEIDCLSASLVRLDSRRYSDAPTLGK